MAQKKKLAAVISIIAAVAILVVIYMLLGAKTDDSVKKITLTVTDSSGTTKNYSIETNAEYLSDAMELADGLTFSGTQGAYGLMLEEVNGERAVYEEDGAYWSILVDGEYGMYGIDSQPIEDGVKYSLVYTLA